MARTWLGGESTAEELSTDLCGVPQYGTYLTWWRVYGWRTLNWSLWCSTVWHVPDLVASLRLKNSQLISVVFHSMARTWLGGGVYGWRTLNWSLWCSTVWHVPDLEGSLRLKNSLLICGVPQYGTYLTWWRVYGWRTLNWSLWCSTVWHVPDLVASLRLKNSQLISVVFHSMARTWLGGGVYGWRTLNWSLWCSTVWHIPDLVGGLRLKNSQLISVVFHSMARTWHGGESTAEELSTDLCGVPQYGTYLTWRGVYGWRTLNWSLWCSTVWHVPDMAGSLRLKNSQLISVVFHSMARTWLGGESTAEELSTDLCGVPQYGTYLTWRGVYGWRTLNWSLWCSTVWHVPDMAGSLRLKNSQLISVVFHSMARTWLGGESTAEELSTDLWCSTVWYVPDLVGSLRLKNSQLISVVFHSMARTWLGGESMAEELSTDLCGVPQYGTYLTWRGVYGWRTLNWSLWCSTVWHVPDLAGSLRLKNSQLISVVFHSMVRTWLGGESTAEELSTDLCGVPQYGTYLTWWRVYGWRTLNWSLWCSTVWHVPDLVASLRLKNSQLISVVFHSMARTWLGGGSTAEELSTDLCGVPQYDRYLTWWRVYGWRTLNWSLWCSTVWHVPDLVASLRLKNSQLISVVFHSMARTWLGGESTAEELSTDLCGVPQYGTYLTWWRVYGWRTLNWSLWCSTVWHVPDLVASLRLKNSQLISVVFHSMARTWLGGESTAEELSTDLWCSTVWYVPDLVASLRLKNSQLISVVFHSMARTWLGGESTAEELSTDLCGVPQYGTYLTWWGVYGWRTLNWSLWCSTVWQVPDLVASLRLKNSQLISVVFHSMARTWLGGESTAEELSTDLCGVPQYGTYLTWWRVYGWRTLNWSLWCSTVWHVPDLVASLRLKNSQLISVVFHSMARTWLGLTSTAEELSTDLCGVPQYGTYLTWRGVYGWRTLNWSLWCSTVWHVPDLVASLRLKNSQLISVVFHSMARTWLGGESTAEELSTDLCGVPPSLVNTDDSLLASPENRIGHRKLSSLPHPPSQ